MYKKQAKVILTTVQASKLQDGRLHGIIQCSESELKPTMPSKYTALGVEVHIRLKYSSAKQEGRTQEQKTAVRNEPTCQQRTFYGIPRHTRTLE